MWVVRHGEFYVKDANGTTGTSHQVEAYRFECRRAAKDAAAKNGPGFIGRVVKLVKKGGKR